MLCMNQITPIPVNADGVLDLRNGAPVPQGCVYVRELRLQPLCRKLGIAYAEAQIGLLRKGGVVKPRTQGVVIWAEDEPALRGALLQRELRRAPERRREAEREARKSAQVLMQIRNRFPGMSDEDAAAVVERAWKVGGGAVGRASKAQDPQLLAVIAHIRHKYTDYDALLFLGRRKRECRDLIRARVNEILKAWQDGNPVPEETRNLLHEELGLA